MWGLLAGWFMLSLLGVALFHLLRSRTRPVPTPPEVRRFLRALEEELHDKRYGARLRGLIPGRFAAVFEVRGQETPVSLHPLFRRWLAFPDDFGRAVGRFVADLEEEALVSPADHVFGDVAPRILPQIRSRGWLQEQGGPFGDAGLVHRSFTDDLVICYVIDEAWCMTFVCRAHLRHWNRTEEDLFHLATRNLTRLAGAEMPLPVPDGEPLVLRSGDGFDAARVLLLDPDRIEGLLVAVPDRDMLWLGRDSGTEGLGALMARAQEQSSRAEHPLSPHLYRVEKGKLVPVTAAGTGS